MLARMTRLAACLAALALAACPPDPGPDDDDGGEGEGEGEGETRDCSWDDLVQSGSILTPQDYALPADCDGPASAPEPNTIVVASDEASFVANFRCDAVDADLNFFTRHVAAVPMIDPEELTVVVEVDGEVTFALTDPGGCRGAQPMRMWRYFTYTAGPYDDHWVETCVEEDCTCTTDCPP